jgi:ABC-type multidrug transport system fused ATPase/permease subunit
MENQKSSLKQIAVNYGVLLALVSILTLVIMYVANMQKSWTLSIIGFAITIYLLFAAIKSYKQGNGGFLKLSDGLKVGLATALVAGLISAFYSYIHYSIINPEYIDLILNEAREQMESSSQGMTEEQKQQALSFTESFTTPFMLSTFSLIGSLFFGFIISLISALILRREEPIEM